ncbi:hypothetical protein [Evansella tamaricis]|uniref:Uncharacterized protein n=1 Tax=Evansella tamaricis TaxID=2069301 RepID=A0ABS6JKZ7_9BACI|nr:hypothetical protein [Evansella tamaricis]MBU9714355.1 hypothetical protein [Evansella tamaricis]
MFKKVISSIREVGWIKFILIVLGSVAGMIVLLITLTFFLLLFMDRFDNRYVDSSIHVKEVSPWKCDMEAEMGA